MTPSGSEGRTFQDPLTGATIRQVTDWRAHSYHLYFTQNDLWDGGRRMVIVSHRGNAENLYSVELSSGELTRITDFDSAAQPHLQRTFVNPRRDEAYFINDGTLLAVDLHSGTLRPLWALPAGYNTSICSCTADGKTVCLSLREDLSDRIRMDLTHGYVGFVEYFEARPHCQIVTVSVDGGDARVIYDRRCWVGHVNTSPTLPDVLTFCHEGPWDRVDHRIWMLRTTGGEPTKLRPQGPGERIGHEYWFADGERVGYHGTRGDVNRFGWTRWDGSGGRDYNFPYGSLHFHSLDETFIVGDGGPQRPHLRLWRLCGDTYEGPRILTRHRGTFHAQILHVHPRMFRDPVDGRLRIVYTADTREYGNVYIADVGEFESLPAAETLDK